MPLKMFADMGVTGVCCRFFTMCRGCHCCPLYNIWLHFYASGMQSIRECVCLGLWVLLHSVVSVIIHCNVRMKIGSQVLPWNFIYNPSAICMTTLCCIRDICNICNGVQVIKVGAVLMAVKPHQRACCYSLHCFSRSAMCSSCLLCCLQCVDTCLLKHLYIWPQWSSPLFIMPVTRISTHTVSQNMRWACYIGYMAVCISNLHI
jgi:hypothetical protein